MAGMNWLSVVGKAVLRTGLTIAAENACQVCRHRGITFPCRWSLSKISADEGNSHFQCPVLSTSPCLHRPAGWDNEKKIAILHENFTRVKPDDAYEDFVAKPCVRKLFHTELVTAEDDQEFLKRLQESPAGGGPAGSPRIQGGADPANVASASPITSVKKPVPNTKTMN